MSDALEQQELRRTLRRLSRGCGRPLGPASAVTRADIAAELGIDRSGPKMVEIDALLAGLSPLSRLSRYPRYVWGEVVEALRAAEPCDTRDEEHCGRPASVVGRAVSSPPAPHRPRAGLRRVS